MPRKKSIRDMHRLSLDDYAVTPKLPIAVVLDNVRSLNNIGSIFRTADAFRIAAIHLCGISSPPVGDAIPEIHKTALGAEQSVPWQYHNNTLDALDTLRRQGYTILCLEQVFDSVSLPDFKPDPDRKYAIVAGNEVDGVDPAVVDNADICIEIPQEGTKHSLNVAVSTAISMWHLYTKIALLQ